MITLNVLAWIIIIGFLISPILDIILVKKLIWYRDELSSLTDDLSSLSLKYNNLKEEIRKENFNDCNI